MSSYETRTVNLSLLERDALRLRWIQVALIIGVLVISPVLVMLLPNQLRMLVMVLPVGFIGFFVLLKWPQLGFLALTTAGMLLISTVPVIGFAALMYIVLTFVWLFKMIALDKELKFVSAPSVTAVLYFAILVILSLSIGQLPWFPVRGAPIVTQIGGSLIYLCSFMAFLLTANLIRDIRWLKWMVYTFLFFAGAFAFLSLVPFGRRFIRSFYSIRATSGSLFWVWTTCMSLSMALFNRKLPIWGRLLCGAVCGAILYFGILVNRQWVSGWVPPVVAVVALVWIGAPKAAIPLSVAAGAGIVSQWSIVYGLVAGDNEYSTISRLDAWRVMFEIINVNPLLGVGPSNYYFYTPLFNILGFYVEFNSHNNYIDLLAQTGYLGLLFFFWVVFAIWQQGYKLLKIVPRGGFAHAFIVASLAGLVASVFAGMLGDWVIPFYYNIGITGLRASGLAWMFWGALVAIEQIYLAGNPID